MTKPCLTMGMVWQIFSNGGPIPANVGCTRHAIRGAAAATRHQDDDGFAQYRQSLNLVKTPSNNPHFRSFKIGCCSSQHHDFTPWVANWRIYTLDTADQLIRQVHQDRPGWRRFRVVRGRQAQDRPPMVSQSWRIFTTLLPLMRNRWPFNAQLELFKLFYCMEGSLVNRRNSAMNFM